MRTLTALAVLLALGAAPAHASRGLAPPPLPGPRALQAIGAQGPTLVGLKDESGAFALQAAGGTLVSSALRLWKVPAAAADLLPRLVAAGVVTAVEPDRRVLRPFASRDVVTDPLVPTEWWIPKVGADTVVAPGPGVPVTVIDAGLDMTHPEFAARPNTTVLNTQTLLGQDDEHGTAVSSVVGAPVNGVGVVGVYPQAVLRAFDASPNATIDEASVIQGITEASLAGRGVTNLSLGGPDQSFFMEEAIVLAFGRGTITVAAAGNEFQNGNPLSFPADDPHVLTVAATTEDDKPAAFSSSSSAVDLAAPGVDIPVAVPLVDDPTGYTTLDGTSFSSPLVAGATAWVWTVRPTLEKTQLYDLMRWSAKDIWDTGWDKDTGFGLLNIPNALTQAPPPIDPLEPNDDINQVRAGGLFPTAKPLVTGTFKARVDFTDDPEDVYRVNVPAHTTLTVTMKPDANITLELWGPLTQTVTENGTARNRDLLGLSARPGTETEAIRWTNKAKKAVVVYSDSYFPTGSSALDADYTLTVKTARARP
jgi:subtilisin family serine protease